MKDESSTMTSLAVLLLIASISLNLCFFAGCRSLHDVVYGNPCKFGPGTVQVTNDSSGKAELVGIARKLGIKTSGKTMSCLASDICEKFDNSIVVPNAFDAAAFEKMAKDLRVEEKKAMREYQDFISGLQGKRVIVIEPEE